MAREPSPYYLPLTSKTPEVNKEIHVHVEYSNFDIPTARKYAITHTARCYYALVSATVNYEEVISFLRTVHGPTIPTSVDQSAESRRKRLTRETHLNTNSMKMVESKIDLFLDT